MKGKGSAPSRTSRAPLTSTSTALAPARSAADFLDHQIKSLNPITRSNHQIQSPDHQISSFHVQVFFFQMESDRTSAEHGDVLDAPAYADALASSRHARALREDRQ